MRNPLAKQVFDDRGRPFVVLRQAGLAEWPVRGDPRIEALRRRIAAAKYHSKRLQRVVDLIIPASLFFGWIIVVGWFTFGYRVLPPWFGGVMLLGGMATWGFVFERASMAGSREVADCVLSEGLCASCGYNLHGVQPDTEMLVVCAECGAAWKQTRIRRSLSFAAASEMGAASWGDRVGPHVFDARGTLTLIALDRVRAGNEAAGAQAAEHRRLELMRVRTRPWLRDHAGYSAGMLLALGGPLAAAWMSGLSSRPTILSFVVSLAAGLPGLLVIRFTQPLLAGWWARRLLDERLCPACTGLLDDAALVSDGCVECPRCLAVWRLTEQPMESS